MKVTPLCEVHKNLGAKLIDFHGWLLPLYYTSIIEEHNAVRTKAGLFDISHMGEIEIRGPGAFDFLQYAITNDLGKITDGQAIYTHICNHQGGVIDDLFVYRLGPALNQSKLGSGQARFFLVVNAATTDKDYEWLVKHQSSKVTIENISSLTAGLALQGPFSEEIAKRIFPEIAKLKHHTATELEFEHKKVIVSRTGYTGEDGFEFFPPAGVTAEIWERLFELGGVEGLVPTGLGARDTLRLEIGYPLYGQDLDEYHTPLEAGLKWVVSFRKGDFIGKEKLLKQSQEGLRSHLVGFVMLDRRIPRPGSRIIYQQRPIGRVTSGSYSPSTRTSIGMGYINNLSAGTILEIDLSGKLYRAKVVKLPFYKKDSPKNGVNSIFPQSGGK